MKADLEAARKILERYSRWTSRPITSWPLTGEDKKAWEDHVSGKQHIYIQEDKLKKEAK